MSLRNVFSALLISLTLSFSQTLMNGYGIGQTQSSLNVSAMGKGSFGITPDFTSGVALANPATWHHLKFTYIQNEYAGRQIKGNQTSGINSSSGFNRTQVIIPVKQKFSFGLSLSPYSTRQLFLTTPEDSLRNKVTYNGEGGSNAFRISFGGRIDSSDAVGLGLTYLFGSSRQESAVLIDESLFQQSKRLGFSGVLLELYIHSERLQSLLPGLSLYGKLQLPLQSVSVKQYSFFPFEDNNGSGYHDRSNIPSEQDFPDPGSVPGPEVTRYTNQYSPYSVTLGMTKGLRSKWIGSGELMVLRNKGAFATQLSPLRNSISGQTGLNVALSRYGRTVMKDWWDRINFSTGYFYNNYTLENNPQTIIQNGIALGFGFKFYATENKIDFSYQLVKTSGLPGGRTEVSNRFAVAVSLGDIWFIKRREL